MAFVADNFQRPDGNLGGNWGPVFAFADSPVTDPTPNGGIQLKGNAFAPIDTGADGALSAFTGVTFGNDQWAQAQIASIAGFTSQVHITACSASAGTSTYTYTTLLAGVIPVTGMWIYVTGMTNSGNNSPAGSAPVTTGGFKITATGVNTFSVLNASPGANESGSSGTGTVASNSICGVAVRCSTNGKNGYILQFGTNAGAAANNGAPVDQRVYTLELWKVVNGVASDVAIQFPPPTTVTGTVGDVYALSVQGTTLRVYQNGTLLTLRSIANSTNQTSFTDTDLTSGSPGIGTWSLGGVGQWTNPTSYATGNSGTSWTNFQAGDTTFVDGTVVKQTLSTNFPGSGDLVTSDSHWSYLDGGLMTVGSAHVTPTHTGEAVYSTVLPTANYAQLTMVTLANSSTQSWAGPTICNQNTNDRYDSIIGNGLSASNIFTIRKWVSGVSTTFASGNSASLTIANGAVITLLVYNGIVTLLLNGLLISSHADTSLTAGKSGIGAGIVLADTVVGSFSAGSIIPAAPGTGIGSSSWLTVANANSLRGLKH